MTKASCLKPNVLYYLFLYANGFVYAIYSVECCLTDHILIFNSKSDYPSSVLHGFIVVKNQTIFDQSFVGHFHCSSNSLQEIQKIHSSIEMGLVYIVDL